ncbi:MAG: hypothetical protein ABIG94_01135 [Pseudomonadota bacterium]
MLKVGFHRASLKSYTGFKSSPYTEGAIFYGEKPLNPRVRQDLKIQVEHVAEPTQVEGAPGGS